MELILDFSTYKDKNIGQLIFKNHILNFIFENNMLSVSVKDTNSSNTNLLFPLFKVENKYELFTKDALVIFSKLSSIPYIKNNLPTDEIINLLILNFDLSQRIVETFLQQYIKIIQINDFVFVYKRNIAFITLISVYQTSKQKKYKINKNYIEETFHLDIINNVHELFSGNPILINDIIHSILQEIS